MEGISEFRPPQNVVVRGADNPWNSVAPQLAQTIIGGLIMSKIKQNIDESLLNKQAEIELAKQGYTPVQGQAQQPTGIMDKIKGMIGLGSGNATTPPIVGENQQGPMPSNIPNSEMSGQVLKRPTRSVNGKVWVGPEPVTDLGGGIQLVRIDGQQHVVKPTLHEYVNPVERKTVWLPEGKSAPEGYIGKDIFIQDILAGRQDKTLSASDERQARMFEQQQLLQAQREAAAEARALNKPDPGYMDKRKAIEIGQKIDLGQQVSPEEASWLKSYKQLSIDPALAYGQARGEIIQHPVIDTQDNNSVKYISANEINESNKATPGRYVPASEGAKALNKTALLEDMNGTIMNARKSLYELKSDFTPAQSAQLAFVLKQRDPTSAWQTYWGSEAARTLTPDQKEYITDLAQIHENAMAMRSVLGAGQGSEDLRNAIRATLPSALTPDKQMANMQLDKFEQQIARLGRGVINVPLKTMPGSQAAPNGPPAFDSSAKYKPGDVVNFPGKGNFKSLGGGKWLPQ